MEIYPFRLKIGKISVKKGCEILIILGIDPGIAIVGYGVIEYKNSKFRPIAYGAIRTPAHTPVEDRLKMIHEELSEIIEKFSPDEMSIEELFFNNNTTTAIVVAEARGVILLTAAEKGLKISEYTPLQIKQSVVGYGKAEKKQVIHMVGTILGLKNPPKLDDTNDALAAAICHAHTSGSAVKQFYNLR